MWECESIYNYLAERGKAERRDRTAAGQTGSSQCASEPLTAHITDRQSELQLQLLDWEWGRPGDLSSLSMAEEEGGAEDTSFLRTVSIVCLISCRAGPQFCWSWQVLQLDSPLSSPLTVEDINVFTLPWQNMEWAELMIVWWRGKKSSWQQY